LFKKELFLPKNMPFFSIFLFSSFPLFSFSLFYRFPSSLLSFYSFLRFLLFLSFFFFIYLDYLLSAPLIPRRLQSLSLSLILFPQPPLSSGILD